MKLSVVVLAAGEGKRMHTQQPKVLQCVAGKPMLSHVLNTAEQLDAEQIYIVHGHRSEAIKSIYKQKTTIHWVEQTDRLGTGHAVLQAAPQIPSDHYVLVLFGDVPLITTKTLVRLINVTVSQNASLGLLVAEVQNPFGLGRIIRDIEGNIREIIEEKDASISQKAIREIFTGILLARADTLQTWLPKLSNDNSQGEYYLTELTAIVANSKEHIASAYIEDPTEILGANTRQQLAAMERAYQLRLADKLMTRGVTIKDPARVDIRASIKTGFDVSIDINAVFEGNVELGDNVVIEPNCVIRDAIIGNNVRIKANTVIEGAHIDDDVQVGPFAHLRSGTVLKAGSKVGNFVEMKKTILGEGSKASHLSYLGDATIGKAVNIGAGTITCNYDGLNKYQTVIEDGVFIGSGTELIAPIKIGCDVTVGAGSTITDNVPAGGLALSRVEQSYYPNWKPASKRKKGSKVIRLDSSL